MEKIECQDKSTPACEDKSTPKCSDGSGNEKAKCDAAWLCDNKKRELCADGKFPRIKHVKDPKKQGRNRPVKKPDVGTKEDITIELSDEKKLETVALADKVADDMVEVQKSLNEMRY